MSGTRDELRPAAADDLRGPFRGVADGVPAALGTGAAGADDAPDDPRGNRARYLRWQARDWVRQRGGWILLFTLLMVALAWSNYDAAAAQQRYVSGLRAAARMNSREHVPTPLERLVSGFLSDVQFWATLGGVAATFGIVARERERGLQRFLFAKPVRIARYYLQKFAVVAIGSLAVVLLGAVAMSAAFHVVLPVGTALVLAAAVFAIVGPLTFFYSTLTRFDGFATLGTLFVALVSGSVGRHDVVFRVLSWLLAPLSLTDAFQVPRLVAPSEPPVAAPLAALGLAAYAAAYVGAGLWVLRRRSITT